MGVRMGGGYGRLFKSAAASGPHRLARGHAAPAAACSSPPGPELQAVDGPFDGPVASLSPYPHTGPSSPGGVA